MAKFREKTHTQATRGFETSTRVGGRFFGFVRFGPVRQFGTSRASGSQTIPLRFLGYVRERNCELLIDGSFMCSNVQTFWELDSSIRALNDANWRMFVLQLNRMIISTKLRFKPNPSNCFRNERN